jgi:hypothetical protein
MNLTKDNSYDIYAFLELLHLNIRGGLAMLMESIFQL